MTTGMKLYAVRPSSGQGALWVSHHASGARAPAEAPLAAECAITVKGSLLRIAMALQMSEAARYKIRPPRLYLEYSAVPVPSAGEELQRRPAKFEVQYLNSAAVTAEFWDAWEICMGIFLSLGFATGFLRALKWKVCAAHTCHPGITACPRVGLSKHCVE